MNRFALQVFKCVQQAPPRAVLCSIKFHNYKTNSPSIKRTIKTTTKYTTVSWPSRVWCSTEILRVQIILIYITYSMLCTPLSVTRHKDITDIWTPLWPAHNKIVLWLVTYSELHPLGRIYSTQTPASQTTAVHPNDSGNNITSLHYLHYVMLYKLKKVLL